ncbi:MAG: MerR family transcriptional regulator [Vulcanimicrobiota bacterium]
MPKEFYNPKQFLEELRSMGLEVSDRTVKYYVAKGLLPKPIHNPYVGADGRVGFFPRDSVKRLRRILQLKNQGFKLTQIRQVLEGQQQETLRQIAAEQPDDWRREVVFRYLHHLGNDQQRQNRTEFLASVAQIDDNELLHRSGRTYLTRELASLVGDEAADKYVEEYFLNVHTADLKRKLTLFRKWRDEAGGQTSEEAPSAFQVLRRATGDLLLRLTTRAEYLRLLETVRQQFEASLERRPLPAAVEGGELLLELAARGQQTVQGALIALEHAAENEDPGALAQALEELKRGHFLLVQTGVVARTYLTLLDFS